MYTHIHARKINRKRGEKNIWNDDLLWPEGRYARVESIEPVDRLIAGVQSGVVYTVVNFIGTGGGKISMAKKETARGYARR